MVVVHGRHSIVEEVTRDRPVEIFDAYLRYIACKCLIKQCQLTTITIRISLTSKVINKFCEEYTYFL